MKQCLHILEVKNLILKFPIFEIFDKNGQGYLMTTSIAQTVYSSGKLHSGLNL